MSSSASSPSPKNAKKDGVPASADGIYEDVGRQLSGLYLKARKNRGGRSKDDSVTIATYLARGSPEGSCPAVKVDDASLGMVGKSSDVRRGLDVFEYTAGTEKIVSVKLALGLDPETQSSLKELLIGVVGKIGTFKNTLTKSSWYQNTFESLNDGTKVYNSTNCIQNPEGFRNVTLDDEYVWESPSSTWGPFLYGDEQDTKWYTKARVSEDAQVYLYSNKKGIVEYAKTSEEGQVVYPKGGVPVKNTNMLKTLLSSKLYSEKMWRAKCVLRLTSISLKCAPTGVNSAGNQQHAVYPVFNFTIPTAVVLVEYNPSVDDEGGLTDKQREDATRAVLFAGMVAPKIKRKSREAAVAPVFKKRKTDSVDVDDDDDEDIDTDGED
jgi:hypothetical protein